jgi:isopentenyl-diphosphate delta-isomerase
VELVLARDVGFRHKTTGLERLEFIHNALPEIDLDDVRTGTTFLGKPVELPLIVGSMTGGYADALAINRGLAEVCEALRIPMGVGSQRQTMEDETYRRTFTVVREAAPSIPVMGNIGAAEVAKMTTADPARRLVEMLGADGFWVHLNPLQELLQPEGSPRYRGVLAGIAMLVRALPVPVLVKEIGAGISADVARRLLDAGVRHIDVAGAGGTSWAGVEILRGKRKAAAAGFWDWGIPTADALRAVASLKASYGQFTLIGSGGISSGMDMARAIALGADLVASARPLLQALKRGGTRALHGKISAWAAELRAVMFLTGSADLPGLQAAPLVTREPS